MQSTGEDDPEQTKSEIALGSIAKARSPLGQKDARRSSYRAIALARRIANTPRMLFGTAEIRPPLQANCQSRADATRGRVVAHCDFAGIGMALKVFISYRRDDSAGHAGRVYDRLKRDFGRDHLVMDVNCIPLGTNFVKVQAKRWSSATCSWRSSAQAGLTRATRMAIGVGESR